MARGRGVSSWDDVDSGMLDSVSYKLPSSLNYPQFSSNYWGPSDLPISPLFIRATSLPPRKPKLKLFDIEYEPETKPKQRPRYISSIDDVAYKPYKPYKPRVFTRPHRPKVEVYSEIFKPMYESTVPKRSKSVHFEPEFRPTRATLSYTTPTYPTVEYRSSYEPEVYRYPYEEFVPSRSNVDVLDYDLLPRQRPRRIFTHRYPVRIGTQIPLRYGTRSCSEPAPLIRRYNRRSTSHIVTPSAMLAVTNARRSLDRIERELGLEPSFEEPTIIHRHARAPVRAVHHSSALRPRVSVPVHASPRVRVRSSSVPASPRLTPRHRSRMADIETRIEADNYIKSVAPTSLSELRKRASLAKTKLDAHKVLMDRYLPIYFGPENDVEYEVDYKYGELVDRMPQLDPYRPSMGSMGNVSKSSVSPYKPVSRARATHVNLGAAPRGDSRPHVSDTRRRIRDVICATRKDPHYFA